MSLSRPAASIVKVLQLLALALILQGCVSTQSDPSKKILGSWQSTVGGFNVLTTYTDKRVSIDGHEALTYTIDDGQLTIDQDQTTRRQLSFPSPGEMVQVDVITGTEHRYKRAADPT